MKEIIVCPKPDYVSWDEIHNVLFAAHEKNRKNGMTFKSGLLSGKELENKLQNGQCFVALEDGKVVGTQSVTLERKEKWYAKDCVLAHSMLSGILPSYQGCGIREDLNEAVDQWIDQSGADMIWAGTAEDNKIVRKLVRKRGYIDVDYIASKGTNYYSVIFVKWLKENPFTDDYCNKRFRRARFWTRFRYKPGKVERFRTIAFVTRVIAKLKSIIKR